MNMSKDNDASGMFSDPFGSSSGYYGQSTGAGGSVPLPKIFSGDSGGAGGTSANLDTGNQY